MIRIGEEIGSSRYGEPCLFFDFPDDTLLNGLIDIGETAGEVERPLGWLAITLHHQQFATTVTDEGDDGS